MKGQITTWCEEEEILDEVIEDGEVDFHLKVRAPIPGAVPSDGTVLDVTRPEAGGLTKDRLIRSMRDVHCPSCGHSGASGRDYCSRCGARLAVGEATSGGGA